MFFSLGVLRFTRSEPFIIVATQVHGWYCPFSNTLVYHTVFGETLDDYAGTQILDIPIEPKHYGNYDKDNQYQAAAFRCF